MSATNVFEPGRAKQSPAFEADAVAHDASGRIREDRPFAYRVRATRIGRYAGPCAMVAVSRSGSVFVSPAVPNQKMGTDLLRSRDGGQSFTLLETPRSPRAVPAGYKLRIVNLLPQYFRRLQKQLPDGCTLHPFLHQDAMTGRLFVSTMMKGACADGSGSILAASDDEGASWSANSVGEGSWDWGKVFTGPPATEASRQALARSGYPNLVYFSATGPTLIYGPNQLTYKSTDGGRTFTRVSDTFPQQIANSMRAGYPQTGVVDSKGTVYRTWAGSPLSFVPFLGKRQLRVNIARSRDEGATWQHSSIAGSRTSVLEPTLAVDAHDTLHLAWADPKIGCICLAMSNDGAETWSEPLRVTPPGIRRAAKVTISARKPGEIALTYWGSARRFALGDGWVFPDGRPYSGYLTVCRDLRNPEPLFWTTRVNPAEAPLLPRGESALRSGEYLGAPAFATDGSIWGAFVSLADVKDVVVARLDAVNP